MSGASLPQRVRELLRTRRFEEALLVLLVAGGVLQVWIANSLWAMDDEGAYIQAALAIAHGSFPLVNFAARPEPILPILLAPLVALLGGSVVIGRYLIIALNLLTATLLAVLAKRLVLRHGEIAGLAAAGFYLLAPWPATQGPVILEEPVAALFVTASLYFLLRDRWALSRWNYPVSGLLLGIGILSRRSAVAVGFVWLAWICLANKTWRTRIIETLRCLWPGILLVGGFFLYVAARTSLNWVLISIATPAGYFEYVPSTGGKIGILAYMLVLAAPLFLAPIVLAVGLLRERGSSRWMSIVSFAGLSSVAILYATYPFFAEWGLGELITPSLNELLIVVFIFWLAMFLRDQVFPSTGGTILGKDYLVLVGWGVAITALDFFARAEAFGVYYSDALAPFAVLFGAWFVSLVPEQGPSLEPLPWRKSLSSPALWRKWAPILASLAVIVLLVVSSLLVATLVLGPTNPDNVPGLYGLESHSIYRLPPQEIDQVGNFLRTHVQGGQAIFSFDTAFVDRADLQITPQIAQYLDNYVIYLHAGLSPSADPYPGAPPGLLPSLQGLLSSWNRTNLTWFVTGPLTDQALSYSALLSWYVATFYHPYASFGDPLSFDQVEILKRGRVGSPASTTVASVTLPTPGSSVAVWNGTTYSVTLGSSSMTYLDPNGTSGIIPLLIPSARFVGTSMGALWIGSAETPQVEVYFLNGSAPELVTVGASPSSIASDPSRALTFVATFGDGQLSAVGWNATLGGEQVLWTSGTGSAITGVTVDPAHGVVFAALPYEDTIESFSEETGLAISSILVAFSPYSIQYAAGGLDATYWGKATIWRVLTSAGNFTGQWGPFEAGGKGTSLISMPSLGAVAVATGTNVTVFQSTTLLEMGSFRDVLCPDALAWDPSTGLLSALSGCRSDLSIVRLASLHWLNVSGPANATFSVEGDPLAVYPLGPSGTGQLALWPQVLTLNLNDSGYLPGQTSVAIGVVNTSVTLTPGPSIAGIQQMQQTFSERATLAAVVALIGTLALAFFWRGGPRSRAPRAPPGARAEGRGSNGEEGRAA